MKLEMTGKDDWEVNRKAVMLSYAYDEVLVERKDGKILIICKGKRKMEAGRAG
jgi:hypothetical protein